MAYIKSGLSGMVLHLLRLIKPERRVIMDNAPLKGKVEAKKPGNQRKLKA